MLNHRQSVSRAAGLETNRMTTIDRIRKFISIARQQRRNLINHTNSDTSSIFQISTLNVVNAQLQTCEIHTSRNISISDHIDISLNTIVRTTSRSLRHLSRLLSFSNEHTTPAIHAEFTRVINTLTVVIRRAESLYLQKREQMENQILNLPNPPRSPPISRRRPYSAIVQVQRDVVRSQLNQLNLSNTNNNNNRINSHRRSYVNPQPASTESTFSRIFNIQPDNDRNDITRWAERSQNIPPPDRVPDRNDITRWAERRRQHMQPSRVESRQHIELEPSYTSVYTDRSDRSDSDSDSDSDRSDSRNDTHAQRLKLNEQTEVEMSTEYTCAVCWDKKSRMMINFLCGHSFHKECINIWLNSKRTCPMCREVMKIHESDDVEGTVNNYEWDDMSIMFT